LKDEAAPIRKARRIPFERFAHGRGEGPRGCRAAEGASRHADGRGDSRWRPASWAFFAGKQVLGGEPRAAIGLKGAARAVDFVIAGPGGQRPAAGPGAVGPPGSASGSGVSGHRHVLALKHRTDQGEVSTVVRGDPAGCSADLACPIRSSSTGKGGASTWWCLLLPNEAVEAESSSRRSLRGALSRSAQRGDVSKLGALESPPEFRYTGHFPQAVISPLVSYRLQSVGAVLLLAVAVLRAGSGALPARCTAFALLSWPGNEGGERHQAACSMRGDDAKAALQTSFLRARRGESLKDSMLLARFKTEPTDGEPPRWAKAGSGGSATRKVRGGEAAPTLALSITRVTRKGRARWRLGFDAKAGRSEFDQRPRLATGPRPEHARGLPGTALPFRGAVDPNQGVYVRPVRGLERGRDRRPPGRRRARYFLTSFRAFRRELRRSRISSGARLLLVTNLATGAAGAAADSGGGGPCSPLSGAYLRGPTSARSPATADSAGRGPAPDLQLRSLGPTAIFSGFHRPGRSGTGGVC